MSRKTGKAKHPWNSSRPSPMAVRNALEKGDMKALYLALTPRQRAFAEEYISDFNASAACVRAGYSAKYATRQSWILLHHEGVAAYIDHIRRTREQQITVANPDFVVGKIMKVINRENVKTADELRGLELLAKILGMLKDRTEISGPDGEAIRIQNEEIEKETKALQNLFDTLSKKTIFLEKPNDQD